MRIACVLNRSETYDSDYVVKLLDGIAKQAKDFQFLVIHNTRWPGWWSKLSLFDPETHGADPLSNIKEGSMYTLEDMKNLARKRGFLLRALVFANPCNDDVTILFVNSDAEM